MAQFQKGDSRINRDGRPKGRRNKLSPEKEIERALKAGMSNTDLVEFMTDKIQNAGEYKLTEQALFKYLAKLIDTKSNLFDQWLKLQKQAEKENPSESNKKGASVKEDNVKQFPAPNALKSK